MACASKGVTQQNRVTLVHALAFEGEEERDVQGLFIGFRGRSGQFFKSQMRGREKRR